MPYGVTQFYDAEQLVQPGYGGLADDFKAVLLQVMAQLLLGVITLMADELLAKIKTALLFVEREAGGPYGIHHSFDYWGIIRTVSTTGPV